MTIERGLTEAPFSFIDATIRQSATMAFPRVKICCITSIDEARLAIQAGAAAIGLVSEMPSGPGVIPEDRIAAIAATTPPGVATFLLTSNTDPDTIIEQQRRCRTNTLQLVDRLSPDARHYLQRRLLGISIVQVVHVGGPDSVDEATEAQKGSHALLLDSGTHESAVKELGGTGRTHDWTLSRTIVEATDIPVFLAGGLNADNVAEAIDTVRPFGVDVCSGVRSDSVLDALKLTAFFRSMGLASTSGTKKTRK